MARIALDRVRIVQAALGLLDARGLEAITARALAAELGVQAGAIYYHLADMQALLDEMATALLREMAAEPVDVRRWEDLLRSMGDRVRRVLNRHRDGARVFAGTRVTDDALLPTMEVPMRVLTGAGLSVDEAFWTMQSVLHFTVGFVIEEQHRRDDEPADYRPEARLARVDAATAPLTAAATGPMLADPDRQFAFGIELLVEGVRTRLPRPERASRGSL